MSLREGAYSKVNLLLQVPYATDSFLIQYVGLVRMLVKVRNPGGYHLPSLRIAALDLYSGTGTRVGEDGVEDDPDQPDTEGGAPKERLIITSGTCKHRSYPVLLEHIKCKLVSAHPAGKFMVGAKLCFMAVPNMYTGIQ